MFAAAYFLFEYVSLRDSEVGSAPVPVQPRRYS